MNILTWDGLADIDSFHGERVMIIDDNEIIWKSCRQYLMILDCIQMRL